MSYQKTAPMRRGIGALLGCAVFAAATFASSSAMAQQQQTFRVGIVTFLSGPASGPFGVPAANAARLLVDALNEGGQLPAPYDKPGFNGARIETVIIDEAGGAAQQVEEFRNLVQRQRVNAVIGYISSGDCLAVSPVAEQLEALTIMFDCGTSRLFLDNSEPKYVFRTGLDAAADNIGAVRYLMATKPDVKRVAGIQQNYAWGQESWADFTASIKQLMPDVQVVDQQFPKIFQGSYGTEISALQTRQPDLIHSSFWGGDMEAFVLQANARGLLSRSTPLLTTGESGIDRFKAHAPNGTILGGRGPFGAFAPDNELNRWFVKSYQERFNTAPTYPSSKMAQAILALKFAIEKAADGKEGVPSKDAIAGALAGATFPSVSGDVRMARANGHQAMQEMIYAEYHFDGKQAQLKNRISFAAECITPPDGTAPLDWIAQDFPGAKCD